MSGATPLVDTQNVRRQTVASRELLDALPTSTKHINTLVTLTPGFTGITDVGGRYFAEAGAYHGKRGTKVSFDGMGIENSSGNSSYQVNAAVVEEMVLQTSGISAEVNADGPVMNIVPKEGGNTFRRFMSRRLYSEQSPGERKPDRRLRARGLQTANKTMKIFDESVSVGGPIKQDKLWFFGAFRTWGMARQFAGVYWNKTQNELLTPPGAEREVVQADAVDRSPARPAQRPVGMVRHRPGPPDVAGASEAQVQLLLRQSARVQLRVDGVATLQEVGRRISVRAEPVHAGDVELAADEPAAARGGRRRVDFAVERVLAARRAGEDRLHHRCRASASATARRRPTAAIRITRTATCSGRR